MKKIIDRKFCVAPMMGYTTPYARNLYRILSKKTFLFSEMIATKTLIHSKNTQSIIANEKQNPIALQVGGSEYDDLKLSSKLAYELNYDEINLNVGCPSKAVQKGSFGACLMQDKKLVRNCLDAMQINNNIEATEFTPRDSYMLKIFNSKWNLPGCINNNNLCQIMGKYEVILPEFNTIKMYEKMNQKCPSLGPNYERPEFC